MTAVRFQADADLKQAIVTSPSVAIVVWGLRHNGSYANA